MGKPPEHVPVLAREVCDALEAALPDAAASVAAGVFVDATCGLGGHTLAVLQRFRPARAIVFDRDPNALAIAAERLADVSCPIEFVHAPFSTLASTLADRAISEVAALIADLGVSSLQFDRPDRGFSLRADGPLDMRMDPTSGQSAARVLAEIGAPALARILREFSEEPDAFRIAKRIVERRPTTTLELAAVVEDAMSSHQRRKLGKRIHPATRTFQALRIHINGELTELDQLLRDAPDVLAAGGRLGVISFHSLEDRRVKQRFRALAEAGQPPSSLPIRAQDLPGAPFRVPSGYHRGITPRPDELDSNPRARSARLRVLERVPPTNERTDD